jgi:uncharacterized C2H2 Zn-finger protein
MDLHKYYYCNLCDKKYKHRQSLNNHINKIHPPKPPCSDKEILPSAKVTPYSDKINSLQCSYCDKIFKRSDYLYKHLNLNRCKVKKSNLEDEKNIIKKELELNLKLNFEKEIDKIKTDMKKEMMDIIKKNCKIHPKTLQKINSQLNNCNITNINIVQLGKEDIVNTLSKKEKIGILNKNYLSFNKLIEHVHFNDKYPQFKNIAITNLKDDYAYKYNEEDNKFIACNKEELLDELIENRTIDLEEILNENIESINNVKVSKLKDLIYKLYDKTTLYDKNKYDIKLMIYNKSENINI